ncbi:hypothetical protein [Alysiella filiformis]|nr:hypothetical protein [Alysiella filiformis]QMT31611.1 hypothetical protein H3L97_01480 [Alysiella filiformis]UBQ55378.1 hypothetical protein JF568_07195 [Alysiella filiformis DSM 16848]
MMMVPFQKFTKNVDDCTCKPTGTAIFFRQPENPNNVFRQPFFFERNVLK